MSVYRVGGLFMNIKDDSRGCCLSGKAGLEIKCHRCGCVLPLLHPHIILERTDEDENLICEECYEKYKLECEGGGRC
jgi:hypothetical protein